jgi:hypothetical protein
MSTSRNTDSEVYKAHEKHAWTLAFGVWIATAAAIILLHNFVWHVKPKWISEILDMAFYVVEFFWVFLLGYFKDYFLTKLLKK